MVIARAAYDALVQHARDAMPIECCGLLIGTADRIDAAVRARNLEESPSRFLIDPLDHFTAIRMARMQGRAVVGVYHSHPARDAQPSASDLTEATYREYVYVIVSPAADPPELRGFRLRDGRFDEVALQVG